MFTVEEMAKRLQYIGRLLNGKGEVCPYCSVDITLKDGLSCPKCGAPRE